MSRLSRILQLRDDAFSASESAHIRMRRDRSIYNSTIYEDSDVQIGNLEPLVAESLDPRVTSSVNRLVSSFVQQVPRIEVFPDQHSQSDLEAVMTEDIENWMEMLDQVDSEKDRLRSLVYHNLVYGTAISKLTWDWENHTYRGLAIDPISFAPDPAGTSIDLYDSNYVCHKTYRSGLQIFLKYGVRLKDSSGSHRIDEIWMKKDVADWAGVDINQCRTPLVRVTLIDDRSHMIEESPFWYPGYPFACWRNFHRLCEGKPHDFWGFGYATLLLPEQKLLDEIWANVVFLMRRLSVGRLVTSEGTFEPGTKLLGSGDIIEIEEGKSIANDIMHLPPDQIPAALFQIVQFVNDIIDVQVPSNTPSFVGEAPFAGASGEAISSLQQAAVSQLGENLSALNEFRLRRAMIKVSHIQQFASRPAQPHKWRGGVDLPETFPEDSRYIGCHARMRDETMFPNTPEGKLQIMSILNQAGFQLAPDKIIDLFNLEKEISPEDLISLAEMEAEPEGGIGDGNGGQVG